LSWRWRWFLIIFNEDKRPPRHRIEKPLGKGRRLKSKRVMNIEDRDDGKTSKRRHLMMVNF
jgi:hypothetical protein